MEKSEEELLELEEKWHKLSSKQQANVIELQFKLNKTALQYRCFTIGAKCREENCNSNVFVSTFPGWVVRFDNSRKIHSFAVCEDGHCEIIAQMKDLDK